MKHLCTILLCAVLISCTNEPILYNQLMYGDITGEIDTGHRANRIRLKCEKQCQTILFSPVNLPTSRYVLTKKQKAQIDFFLKKQRKHETVYIAACDGIPIPARNDRWLLSLVSHQVRSQGYKVWITQPVFPSLPYSPRPQCVQLLRGHLGVIVPSCPNLNVLDSVYQISSNSGCAQARALASMITDPWDLIRAGDEEGAVSAARLIKGNKNHNEGKKVEFKSAITDLATSSTLKGLDN